MAEAKKSSQNTGKVVAIIVAGVVALAGIVVAVLFATGVLGGPNVAGSYKLTGMKQGDEDMSSLLSLLTAGGGEMTLEMKNDGTCTMKTVSAKVDETEKVDGEDTSKTDSTEMEESTTPCTYDLKNKTISIENQSSSMNIDKDTITIESDGLSMIYTRKK